MSTEAGRRAEEAVVDYLRGHGYEVLAQNWRTRWCEIDIVAKQSGVVYFVEVKFRHNSKQGSGLDYITPKKLNQMRFAADVWVAENDWRGLYELAAIEVGPDYTPRELIII